MYKYPESDNKTENIWRILGSYNINGDIVAKLISTKSSTTTTSTLTTDLGNFYNTLDNSDTYIYQTNYFNCNSATCSTSTYSNIGLLSLYEYNTIGGYNSYLSNLVTFLIDDNTTIKEVNQSDIVEITSESSLRPTIYLKSDVQVSGSGSVDDPYILSETADVNLVAYTLNGESTSRTFADLLTTNVIRSIDCKNGSVASWSAENNGLLFTTINTPDYCTLNFGDGYTVTLSATNGTVSSPVSQTVGSGINVSFIVTPSDGYITELDTDTCDGTLSGSIYTIGNVTSALTCSITFKKGINLYDKILADNSTISTRSSFSSSFTDNTTGTIYTATEKNVHNTTETAVYYYAGNTTNNWVKFGKYPSDWYSCYDSNYKYTQSSKEVEGNTCEKIASKGDDIYWRIIRTNADGSIRLLYHGTSTDSTSAYIGISAFNSTYTDPMYVGYMYGTSGSIFSNRNNTNNSTIKITIDTWYQNNLLSYASYLSTTAVYCNDRSHNAYSKTSTFYYGAYYRASSSYSPTYDCTTAADAFSGSNESAKLSYSIGLMTADEIMYAGGKENTSLSSPYAWYYLNSVNGSSTGSQFWWLLSPNYWLYYASSSTRLAYGFFVGGSGYAGNMSHRDVSIKVGVRPVLSVKSTTVISGGTGTSIDPYKISGN